MKTELNGSWMILFKLGLVLLPICTAFMGWLSIQVQENSRAIAGIEANRFTSADGLDVWREIGLLREELAKVPKEIPPAWFVARFDRLEHSVSQIASKLDNHILEHQR